MDINRTELERKFMRLFTDEFPRVKNFALMLMKSEADAEDVAQEVFGKLWQKPDLWADEAPIEGYLFTMTRNMILNIFRNRQIRRIYEEKMIESQLIDECIGEITVLDEIYYKELSLLIRMELEKMPQRRKEIFKMSRFEHKSNKEIAELLCLSVRTVEHQIYLALSDLKKVVDLWVLLVYALELSLLCAPLPSIA